MPTWSKWGRVLQDGQAVIGLALFGTSCAMLGGLPSSALSTFVVSLVLIVGLGHATLRVPGGKVALSVSEPLIFGVMLLGGLWPATFLAGLDGFLSSARHTRRLRVRVANGSILAISYFVAGCIVESLAPLAARGGAEQMERLLPATLAGALAAFVVNSSVVATVNSALRGLPLLAAWKQTTWTLISSLIGGASGLAIYSLQQHLGALALSLALPAAALVYYFFWSWLERNAATETHHAQLRELHARTMEAFALAIDSRHPHARGHARRVQIYSEQVAGLLAGADPTSPARDRSWVSSLSAAALLHDIGKIGIPDRLLARQRRELSSSELETVRRHATLGAAILGGIPFPHPLDPAIRHHHEHWDGTGYPDRLRGDQIPLEARIIALANQLDHVHHEQIAPPLNPLEPLRAKIAALAGTMLDPRLCELYCQHAETVEAAVDQILSAELEEAHSTAALDKDPLTKIGHVQREAGMLYDLARDLGSTLELESTCRMIVEQLLEMLPASSCALYVFDDGQGVLVPQAAAGPLSGVLQRRRFAPGEGMTGWCYEVGEPAIAVDPRVDLGWDAERKESAVEWETVVPLKDSTGTLGAISFYSATSEDTDSNEFRVLDGVLPQLTLALRNAMLYESTRTTSMTDPLTGLPNSRHFYGQLEMEIARATRKGLPLVVVVLDLDGFKPVNDTYGHQAGDVVLRGVAGVLTDTFRRGDIVCRYAGDEFVAILPETTPEEASGIVQRVQQTLDRSGFPVEIRGETVELEVGISAGSSCFPLDGASVEDLVHRADKEMYRNKAARHAATKQAAESPGEPSAQKQSR